MSVYILRSCCRGMLASCRQEGNVKAAQKLQLASESRLATPGFHQTRSHLTVCIQPSTGQEMPQQISLQPRKALNRPKAYLALELRQHNPNRTGTHLKGEGLPDSQPR